VVNLPISRKNIAFLTPQSTQDLAATAEIFREYAIGLGVDLCFQDFDTELADLPGDYAPPRGVLLLASVDGVVAGCCALRPPWIQAIM
jgi:hypothetical protein